MLQKLNFALVHVPRRTANQLLVFSLCRPLIGRTTFAGKVVAEDIMRFGSPDNYWCFQYERAVGRYVKQTSNRMGVEKTFARKESQREFIKIWSERNKLNVLESNQRGKFDQEKMVASSLQAARKLVEKSEFSNETRANNGVLIGKGHPHVIAREEEPNIETCLTLNNIGIRETPSMATTYKSALLPLHNLSCGGTVYKSGNEVSVLLQGDEEVIMKIIHFYLLCVEKQCISIAIGDRYKRSNAVNGEVLRHPLSDGIIVQPSETNFCVLLKDITRKVMLYPYCPGQFAVIDPARMF